MKNYKFILLALLLTAGIANTLQAEEQHEEDDNHEELTHIEHAEEEDDDDHDEHEGEDNGPDEHGEEEVVTLSPQAAATSGVISSIAQSMKLKQTIPLTGKIMFNDNRTSTVRSRLSGVIEKVNVNLGDVVKKGQKIGVLYSNNSLSTYDIIAPLAGTVIKRNTNLGDVIEGEELFTISDLTSVWAKFHVFPTDASKLKKGQSISIESITQKVPKQEASVSMIFPTADTYSQTIIAIATVENVDNIWKPGINIKGQLVVNYVDAEIAIPLSAIQTFEGKKVIFIKEDNSYEPRAIKTGANNNGFVEILGGLSAGEEYVSSGSFVIKADLLKSTASHSH
tara:strand:- start:44746 stop:45759 length:1014 start_codon:yes stop_codon:yes gene_type:complete